MSASTLYAQAAETPATTDTAKPVRHPTILPDLTVTEPDPNLGWKLAEGVTYDPAVVEYAKARAAAKGYILHVQRFQDGPKKPLGHRLRLYHPHGERMKRPLDFSPYKAGSGEGAASPLSESRESSASSSGEELTGVPRESPSGKYLTVDQAFTLHQPMIESRARAHLRIQDINQEDKIQDAQIRTWQRMARMYPDGKVPHEHSKAMANKAFDFAIKDTKRSPVLWGHEDPGAAKTDIMTPAGKRQARESKIEKPERINPAAPVRGQEEDVPPPPYEVAAKEEHGPTVWDIREMVAEEHRPLIDAIMEQQETPVFRSGGSTKKGQDRSSRLVNIKALSERTGIPRHKLYSEAFPALRQHLLQVGIAPSHFAAEVVKHGARAQSSVQLDLYCALWNACFRLD